MICGESSLTRHNPTRSAPFGAGSVSVGLHAYRPSAAGRLADLAAQARLAVEGGFDGFTLAEHHAGLNGYVPNPGQVAGWLLGEVAGGWAAACPILLPLRSAALVAEEIAWLAARHPGRVGVGFAPGFAPADFAIAGVAVEDRRHRFAVALPVVVACLVGAGALLSISTKARA